METKQTYRVGEFYLTRNRQGKWCRTWYDESSQQRKQSSLRTESFERAKELLDEYFIQNSTPVFDKNLAFARCAVEYIDQHSQFLARKNHEIANIEKWLHFFPGVTVYDIRPAQQRKFIKSLVDKGYSKSFVEGVFKTGAAAINYAWSNDMLSEQVPIISASKELSKYEFTTKPKATALEIHEIANFIDNSTVDRLVRYVLILIGCACRPAAAIELEGSQIDLEAGTIDLLKPGQVQNNKYRATVKLPSFIREIYHPENLVYQQAKSFQGRPVDSIRRAWNGAKRRGNCSDMVVPYSFRHTMAKWLRSSGVNAWHTSSQLGHKRKGSEITEIYAPNDPSYLDDALEAIEVFYRELYSKSSNLQELMNDPNK